jgi:Homeodomain
MSFISPAERSTLSATRADRIVQHRNQHHDVTNGNQPRITDTFSTSDVDHVVKRVADGGDGDVDEPQHYQHGQSRALAAATLVGVTSPSLPGVLDGHRRRRTAFTSDQLLELEKEFHSKKYLSLTERSQLAHDLQLSEVSVSIA